MLKTLNIACLNIPKETIFRDLDRLQVVGLESAIQEGEPLMVFKATFYLFKLCFKFEYFKFAAKVHPIPSTSASRR